MSNTIYRFYVYAYLRKDGSPYYIGKGTAGRAFEKHNIVVPKDHSRIVFLEKNLSNVGACALERQYIRWYGRKDNQTGILRNLTDGGDGVQGIVFSEETRKKIALSKMYNTNTKGKTPTKEHRQKISDALRGRINGQHSQERKTKISKSLSEKNRLRNLRIYYDWKSSGLSIRQFCIRNFIDRKIIYKVKKEIAIDPTGGAIPRNHFAPPAVSF